VRVSVLGAAAGGGFPQWNCNCHNCRRLRRGDFKGSARTQVQIAFSSAGQTWHLLGASPDLARQIEANPFLHPREGLRGSPVASVVLTCAEADQVLGLLLLREMQPFVVYATPSVREILEDDNSLFQVLHRSPEQVEWRPITPPQPFTLEPELEIEPLPLGGGYPGYVGAERVARCRPDEAVLGLEIRCLDRRTLYLPGLPSLDDCLLKRMERSDLLLLDGTFWADNELASVWPGARMARAMGHLPISGPQGSLERLRHLSRPRKIFIHINNTNPILDEDSAAYQSVVEAGWEVARDGMTIVL
jgi:pyrroloquinoline quinone biosynthesis protein B